MSQRLFKLGPFAFWLTLRHYQDPQGEVHLVLDLYLYTSPGWASRLVRLVQRTPVGMRVRYLTWLCRVGVWPLAKCLEGRSVAIASCSACGADVGPVKKSGTCAAGKLRLLCPLLKKPLPGLPE